MNDLVISAAKLLLDARRAHRQIEPQIDLAHVDDAYAIQDAVLSALGPAGGWKVGAKGPTETPNSAPLLAVGVQASPGAYAAAEFHMIGIEAELAFRLGRDLTVDDLRRPDEALLQAIASVHPAIEIVDTRIADWRSADRLWLLADNQMNAGFVAGRGLAEWRRRDFERQPVRLMVDGAMVVDRIGGNLAGDPRRLICWLIRHCLNRKRPLRQDMFITTGSCTGMIFVAPGARVRAEFPDIGDVDASFSRQ